MAEGDGRRERLERRAHLLAELDERSLLRQLVPARAPEPQPVRRPVRPRVIEGRPAPVRVPQALPRAAEVPLAARRVVPPQLELPLLLVRREAAPLHPQLPLGRVVPRRQLLRLQHPRAPQQLPLELSDERVLVEQDQLLQLPAPVVQLREGPPHPLEEVPPRRHLVELAPRREPPAGQHLRLLQAPSADAQL